MWKSLCSPPRQNFNRLSLLPSGKHYFRALRPLFSLSLTPLLLLIAWPTLASFPNSCFTSFMSPFLTTLLCKEFIFSLCASLVCCTHIYCSIHGVLSQRILHRVQDGHSANTCWRALGVTVQRALKPKGLGFGKCVSLAKSLHGPKPCFSLL